MDFLPGLSVQDLQHLCDDLTLLVAGQPLPGNAQELAEERDDLLALLHLTELPDAARLFEPDQDLQDRLDHADLDLTDLWNVAAAPLPQWALLLDALDVLQALEQINPDALALTDGVGQIRQQVLGLFSHSTSAHLNATCDNPDADHADPAVTDVARDHSAVRVAAAVLLDALVASAATVSVMLTGVVDVRDRRDTPPA